MWTSFAAVTGGASAGLTGLTFIVVSFRFDTIAVSEEYRNRAAQTISLFLTTTVVAVMLTVPQPTRALGAELIAVAALSALLLRSFDVAARRQQTTQPSIGLRIGLIAFVGCTASSGLVLMVGGEWGMYFYVGSAVIAIVGRRERRLGLSHSCRHGLGAKSGRTLTRTEPSEISSRTSQGHRCITEWQPAFESLVASAPPQPAGRHVAQREPDCDDGAVPADRSRTHDDAPVCPTPRTCHLRSESPTCMRGTGRGGSRFVASGTSSVRVGS